MIFSQRIGKSPIKIIQIDNIDNDLKNRLWNVILEDFFYKIDNYSSYGNITKREKCFIYIWKEFFKQTVDNRPHDGFYKYFRNWFFNQAEWYEIYDFIEFIAIIDKYNDSPPFIHSCNAVLKKELSGYRIIDGKIVPITSEEEVVAIEEAITNSDKWRSVNTHLNSALDNLADRKNPNYRNSIKESISAVEALCKIIVNKDNATLGEALSEIKKQYGLHKALKNTFSSLYGYTSDSSGIRHALSENDREVTLDDAKFILVTCSAFINYIKAKYAK